MRAAAGLGAVAAMIAASSTLAAAPALAPAVRAKQILDAQVAALSARDSDARAAIVDSFDAAAIALMPDARAAHGDNVGLREAIARLSPHDTLQRAVVTKLVAGGNDGAVWWSAELTLTIYDAEPETRAHVETTLVRITELATADAGWKVVAAAFSEPGTPPPSRGDAGDIASATAAGPLAPLLANPVALDGALSGDASTTVFGTSTGELAYGPAAAHKQLRGWSKLALSPEARAREVHGASWGFAIANISWQQPKEKYRSHMAGLVIGVPDATAAGGWRVVAVQYTAS